MKNIHEAFVDVGSLTLAPVRQYLFETYEEEYRSEEHTSELQSQR